MQAMSMALGIIDNDAKLVKGASGQMSSWKVSNGKQIVGPFAQQQVRSLLADSKITQNMFLQRESEVDDWQEISSVPWISGTTASHSVRYCIECDARILLKDPEHPPKRCPGCFAPTRLIDYLTETGPESLEIPKEPWGKFEYLMIAFSIVVLLFASAGIFSLVFNPSLSAILGSILFVIGGGFFIPTFQHRIDTQKYRFHLERIENLLQTRTAKLELSTEELVALKRNLTRVKEHLDADFNERCRNAEVELEMRVSGIEKQKRKLQELRELQEGVVHRMASRFLTETQKWWTQKLTGQNFQTTKEKISKAIEFCRKHGYEVSAEDESQMMHELKKAYEGVIRKENEREEQRRIKEQIREEQRIEREIKKELERIAKEENAIEKALEEALKRATDEHSTEIEMLKRKLQETQERAARAKSQAQLTKAGHVYVISNLGSFGENVFKVGMTRRLEPNDRVKELGDASVPFPFDVHMMISCNDAPSLENALHRALHKHRINKVNFRKEFFRVPLSDIVRIIEENHGSIDYIADIEALQYRESLTISDEDFDYLARLAEENGIYDDDDNDENQAGDK